MKLFDRLNKNRAETVPAEVQDYYRSERRERTGLAWLLALGTLIVTVLIAAGLFFGGRWVYRKVAGTDSSKASTQQEEQGASQQGVTSSTNTDQSNSGQSSQSGQQNQQQSSGSGQQSQQTSQQPTPQTLVNTGPDPALEHE